MTGTTGLGETGERTRRFVTPLVSVPTRLTSVTVPDSSDVYWECRRPVRKPVLST